MAWYPDSGTDVNVALVINTPGADYTSLASFGSAQDFGSNLVASMDRSFTRSKGRPAEEVCFTTRTSLYPCFLVFLVSGVHVSH